MTSRRLPPNEDELRLVAILLEEYIPLDEDLKMSYHSSQRGNTAVRICGVTRECCWFVDMYRGPWFRIVVPGFEGSTADNHFSMIAQLGVKLKG